MEPTERNRRAWDELHRPRARSAPAPGIPPLVRARLPELRGRHVLHLQCGTGEATAELAERGALVTAVDPSAEALAVARTRSDGVAWVQGDLHSLPLELRRGRFELVYTAGPLSALRDLDAWAAGIAAALRPEGYLLLHDEHPVLACLDGFRRWRRSYFDRPPEGVAGLGAVATALAQAGLTLPRLEELAAVLPGRRHDPRVPGHFLLLAAKPFAARPERKSSLA